MPRVRVDHDEYYPFYWIADGSIAAFSNEVELTDEQIARVHAVMKDFEEIQEILSGAPRVPLPEPRFYYLPGGWDTDAEQERSDSETDG